MTGPKDSNDDSVRESGSPASGRLEAYLDGQLNAVDAAAFASELRSNPALRRQAELQSRIDGALERLFKFEAPSHESMAAALTSAVNTSITPSGSVPPVSPRTAIGLPAASRPPQPPSNRRYWAAAVLVAAAGLAFVLATLPWGAGRPGPLFAARPLVEIYNDALASGFEPTYECNDPKQFADTFLQRQGTPLRLLEMPAGTQMLGLAYVGGLSRQTTAMLSRVDGQPVVVFVDRAEADQAIAPDLGSTKLRVFRQERDGLVFYEVTPLPEPRVMEFIAPLDRTSQGASASG